MEETFSFLEENDSINNTKIIKEKSLFFTNINCIENIKCNNKDYFAIGVSDSDSKSVIEIYDFFKFEKIGSSELDYRKIINIKQIFSHNLLVSTGKYLRIFAFNLEFDIFQIILVQQIEIQFHNEIFKWFSNFLKPFIFDINLFREKGNVLPKEYKLIANTTSGIYLYTKKIKKENDKYTQYNIYVTFKSEIPTYKIYYKYKSSNSDDVSDFILGVFTSSYSTDYVRNGTEYTFTLTWTHKSAKYLLFIPDELDGIDEYTIQNGEPLTEGEKLFRYIIFGIIGVLILVGVLIILIKFRIIKCCC